MALVGSYGSGATINSTVECFTVGRDHRQARSERCEG